VEQAYAFLFKMVVDSYLIMEEQAYEDKKERLREIGFVDYYEALEYNSPILSQKEVDHYIKTKKGVTPAVDSRAANQGLHATSLIPYQTGMDSLKSALDKITDEKRQHFLHFSFIRLANARMTLEDALKNGSLAMTKVGLQTRQRLELGFDYIINYLPLNQSDRIFEMYDFFDLYKVGNSLIEITKRKLKKALSQTPFEKEDFSYFLGMYWNSFLDNSEEDVTKYKFDGSSKALDIRDLNSYRLWIQAAESFIFALPFIQTFFRTFEKLRSDGLLNDQFYLNYEVENIDFEAIMISSFINFSSGYYEKEMAGKMGVTVSELKTFYKVFFTKQGDEYLIKGEEDPILRQKTHAFIQKFGLELIPAFDKYLYQIMLEQLNGYEIDSMSDEEFKHVGGPILLSGLAN
jgi:hypothetical protein